MKHPSQPGMALSKAFFARDPVSVAEELLGCRIIRGEVEIILNETEAYCEDDTACHAHRGRTPRTEVMWGEPGHLYVYLCYGIHHLVNVICQPPGQVGCVLLRGGTVVAGQQVVRKRRRGALDCAGPGKLGAALDLRRDHSGLALGHPAELVWGPPPATIVRGPRVGIGYATERDRDMPWRFQAG